MPHPAFDVYGTLIDHLNLLSWFEVRGITQARELVTLWREKLLEYTFHRALMGPMPTSPPAPARP